MTAWLARRRNALLEAAALLEDLGIDQTRRIDVFGAISQLDLWLTFVPLQGLLGACVPLGRGGIMVTTERQPSVQRYTAAHEVGHWILDHERAWFDGEPEVLGTAGPERERLAQLFAAYFLMPPPLIHATADIHGVVFGQPVAAPQAYLMARDMGVSYEATVRQLKELDFIPAPERERLLGIPPLRAKRDLAHGVRPIVGYADVWPIDEQWSGQHLEVTVNDEIVIALPESRSTGYRWMTSDALAERDRRRRRPAPHAYVSVISQDVQDDEPGRRPRPAVAATSAAEVYEPAAIDLAEIGPPLAVVADHYAPGWNDRTARAARTLRRQIADGIPTGHDRPRVGATGRRWLALQAREEGTWQYELLYAPTHEPDGPAVAAFRIEATVSPLPTIVHRRALLAVGSGDAAGGAHPTT